MIGLGFRDSGGDDADADFGHELDGHSGARVGALEIVDELLQVLDRVDVVMRRRRDQADASGRVTSFSDRARNLVSG